VPTAHLCRSARAASHLAGLAGARPEVLKHRALERELFFFIEAGDHVQASNLVFHTTPSCYGDFSDEIAQAAAAVIWLNFHVLDNEHVDAISVQLALVH
jgi:hypothetical protein